MNVTQIRMIKIEILVEKCSITFAVKLNTSVSQKLTVKLLQHKLHKILLPILMLSLTHRPFVIHIGYEALSIESMVAFF